MTLLELLGLSRRHWRLFVELPIVCLAVCALIFMSMPTRWEAEALLVASARSTAVAGIADAKVDAADAEGVDLLVSVDTGRQSVVITAQGEDPAECVGLVNDILYSTVESAGEIYPKIFLLPCPSEEAVDLSPDFTRALIFFAMLGIFLAVTLLLLYNEVFQPVKNRKDVSSCAGFSVLGEMRLGDEKTSQRVLSSVLSLSEGSRCLHVISNADDELAKDFCFSLEAIGGGAVSVADDLIEESQGSGFGSTEASDGGLVLSYSSSSFGVAQCACDTVPHVLVVQPWKDSISDLKSLAEDLHAVSPKIPGVVVCWGSEKQKGLALFGIFKAVSQKVRGM